MARDVLSLRARRSAGPDENMAQSDVQSASNHQLVFNVLKTSLLIQGTVLRKRALGRQLSFITIQPICIEPPSVNDPDLIVVKFERIVVPTSLKPGFIVRVKAIHEDLQALVAAIGKPGGRNQHGQGNESENSDRVLRLEALEELTILEVPPVTAHHGEARDREDAPQPFAGPRGRAGLCRAWARAAIADSASGEAPPGCIAQHCPFRHAFAGDEEAVVRRQAEEAEEARFVCPLRRPPSARSANQGQRRAQYATLTGSHSSWIDGT